MIAASAIASLPFINTFSDMFVHLPFYFNYAIGAHCSAESTANAVLLVYCFYGMMSLFVDLVFCKDKYVFGACVNAQSATLAPVGLKC